MAPQGGVVGSGQAITWPQNLRSTLAQFVSTEERLGISVTLAMLAFGIAVLLAPRPVSRATAELWAWVLIHPRVLDAVTDTVWLFSVTVVVRTLRLAVFVDAVLSLLLLWGYTGLATDLTELLAVAVPNAAKLGVIVAPFAGALAGTDVPEEKPDSYAAASDNINAHQQGIVFRVLQLAVLLAVGMTALMVWQVRIGGLLVGAGFLGIVVGVAVRQTLRSLIAGFVLMFPRSFELGDWVEIDDVEGIVTDITIVNTRLSNADGETVVFPNDRVTNAKITNRTKRNRLRLRLDAGINYRADIERVEPVAEEALSDLRFIEGVPKPQVMPTTPGDSAIGPQLRFWITNPSVPRRAQAKAEVFRSVKLTSDREGVKIPHPQRELLAREEADGFQLREDRHSQPVEVSVSRD